MRDGSNPKLLRRLARATGGESYQPRRVEDIPEAFERIAKDIRNAYTLAYTPTKSERRRRAGGGARCKVYVRSQDGRVADGAHARRLLREDAARIGNEGDRGVGRAACSSVRCSASASAASACMRTRPSKRGASRPSRPRRSSAPRRRKRAGARSRAADWSACSTCRGCSCRRR